MADTSDPTKTTTADASADKSGDKPADTTPAADDKPATDTPATPSSDPAATPAAGDKATPTPDVPTTPSTPATPSAPADPDPIAFQDQGVFYANMLEVVRVLNVVGNRMIAVEGKVKNMAGGTDLDPAVKELPGKVSDMQAAEKAMQSDIAALKDEVKKLGFPDASK